MFTPEGKKKGHYSCKQIGEEGAQKIELRRVLYAVNLKKKT